MPVPAHVEFPSLAEILQGKGKAPHDAVFLYYQQFQRAVRTRDYKLIVYPKAGVTQLFDIKKDPWAIANLARKPEHAKTQKELLARLHRFQKELGDTLAPV
ncbi:MAG: arylsulfatase family protein [Candidatus Solibacter sp.]|nr:arylsulfatase family protein [Candidatus Solibacter sp.]